MKNIEINALLVIKEFSFRGYQNKILKIDKNKIETVGKGIGKKHV